MMVDFNKPNAKKTTYRELPNGYLRDLDIDTIEAILQDPSIAVVAVESAGLRALIVGLQFFKEAVNIKMQADIDKHGIPDELEIMLAPFIDGLYNILVDSFVNRFPEEEVDKPWTELLKGR